MEDAERSEISEWCQDLLRPYEGVRYYKREEYI